MWDKPDFLSQTTWRQFLKRYGQERVQEVLSWVAIIQPENPVGYVTIALKDAWVEPATVRQARVKQVQAELAAQAQRQAQVEAEALKARQAQELEALHAWWTHLAPEIQERLRETVSVDDVVRAGLSSFVAPTILMHDPTNPSPLWLRVARHKMQEQGVGIPGQSD
ncbi:hypothetical protein [Sulfobacillus thermosulfidooxidans]|uniref:hypothetical protein n=1 Tax=Sulfobacillus thermosulfidooxidans TaxID=28034 RepID=UPI000300BAB2|nr:hypothetical protein [Sulfobacillus thermosulfidooxidans]